VSFGALRVFVCVLLFFCFLLCVCAVTRYIMFLHCNTCVVVGASGNRVTQEPIYLHVGRVVLYERGKYGGVCVCGKG